MDKQILNAIAEVLKEEKERVSSEISLLSNEKDAELSLIKESIANFSQSIDKKLDAVDFDLAMIGRKELVDSVFAEFQQWAEDFSVQKDIEFSDFEKEFEEIRNISKSIKDGVDGLDGKDGADGSDGSDGRDGVDNPAIAPICIDRNFKADKGLIVNHRGGLWQAIRNTNGDPEVDSGNWRCFVDGVSDVSIRFDAKDALYAIEVEKTNGEKESLSFERLPSYLPAGDHKSVEGDYFLDGTTFNVYVQGAWVGVDLKGEQGVEGKDGMRGRKGKDGVGIDDVFILDKTLKVLLTNGETKDLYLDILNTEEEEIDQEIKRYAGVWHSSKSYSTGDVVTLMNSLYVCLNDSSDSPEVSADWTQMIATASGPAGDASGGGGSVNLNEYVKRPSATFQDEWLVYKESAGSRDWAPATTDLIKVNPIPFRNSRNGQFIGTPEELAGVETQRDYNELVYKWLGEIEAGDVNLDGYLQELTAEQKIEIIEAQIQYRGLMDLDADDKPLWPADQTKDRGGWWAYPTSKTSGWTLNNLKWLFTYRGEVTEDGSTLTSNITKGYQVGDIIQLQIKYNEAGAGTGYKYADVQPVFVEYKVEELHYPDRLSGNSNSDFPAYRVSMVGPAHRYTGRLPTEIKGPQGDPSDAWIQWYPTDFAYGTPLGDYVKDDRVDDIENRVEDIEAVLPAAESVSPVPTGDLELKITGSRPTGATGEAGKLLMWKAEAGSGGSPYNEVKFPVDDVDAINLDANGIWFKQGELVQKWNVNSGGWFTNVNVLHISTTLTEGDTLVTDQPVEMYYADPSAVYAPVISVAESKADDRRLQVEIEQLALGLETLLTQRAVGEWRYDGNIESGPPREAGTFKAMADMSSVENYLALHMEDLNGITHGFGDAEIGDYIELVDIDDPSVYALYVLTAEPPISGTLVELPVKLKDRGADFQVGDTCIIRHFAIGEEDINLTELDDRFVNVTGDAMSGKLKAPLIETDAIDATSAQGTVYTGAMENGNNIVTNQWVKNQISNTPSQALPTWELAHFSQGQMQPGKMAFCDGNLNGTNRLEAARGIAFSAVDANGRRVARDRNAVDYERTYGSVLSVLSDDDTTIMSMARTIGSVAATIYYSAEFDAYMIIWPQDKDLAVTSNITHVVQDQSYQIHCPELFF